MRLAVCIVWFGVWAGPCTKMVNRTILLCTNHEHRAIITWPTITYFFHGIYNVTTISNRPALWKCLSAVDHRMCACVWMWHIERHIGGGGMGSTASFDCDKTYLGCRASIFIGHFQLDSHKPAGQRDEDKDLNVPFLLAERNIFWIIEWRDGMKQNEWTELSSRNREKCYMLFFHIYLNEKQRKHCAQTSWVVRWLAVPLLVWHE